MTHRRREQDDPLRETAITALSQVIDPLVSLMIDAGVTVREFSGLVRERAVRAAAQRVAGERERPSKARVAIMTGLPRSEVARILDLEDIVPKPRGGQHPAKRVLAAWYDDPKYLAANGDPAVLPIFGKRRTFERLVMSHSRGIPVRAMLDELAAVDAIEILPEQRVKAKSRLPILRGLTSGAITSLGDRARDLLETLATNVRDPTNTLFEATAMINDADPTLIAMLRRDIADQGTQFINGINSLLIRSRKKQGRRSQDIPTRRRLGVTVYYFQDPAIGGNAVGTVVKRRKNFRRRRSI